MSNGNTSELGRAVQEVSEKAQVLIREEIALAKTEVSEKASRLIRGAVVGIVAGIFAVIGLLFLLHGAAWAIWSVLTDDPDGGNIWLGFIILALILFVLGAIAGFLALRFVKKGVPPTPQMAIEEAQAIRQTIATSRPGGTGSSGTVAATRASGGGSDAAAVAAGERR